MARTPLNGLEVVTAITTALRAAFTTQQIVEIYKNPQNQNFKTPSITVSYVNLGHDAELKGTAKKSFIVDIRAHPTATQPDVYTWAATIADKVIETIRYIDIDGDLIKPYNLETNLTDNVLHVIASYSFRVVYVEDSAPDMTTLTINTERVN